MPPFFLDNLPDGVYNIAIHKKNHLAAYLQHIIISGGQAVEIENRNNPEYGSFVLRAGDMDSNNAPPLGKGDGAIGPLDYSALIGSYGLGTPGGYHENDLNDDGQISPLDYSIFIGNYVRNVYQEGNYYNVNPPPAYTMEHYVDEGFEVRFPDAEARVANYHGVVADKLNKLFGVNILTPPPIVPIRSAADDCKITVTSGNLADPCYHSPNCLTQGVLFTKFINKNGSGGTNKLVKYLWTGHILKDNERSLYRPVEQWSLMTPWFVSSTPPSEIRKEYIYDLMHETSHALGVPEHYCFEDPVDNCSNLLCTRCHGGTVCFMMATRPDIEAININILYCKNCIDTINAHLADHH